MNLESYQKTFLNRKFDAKKDLPRNRRTINFMIKQLTFARDIHKEWILIQDKEWHEQWVYIYDQLIKILKNK